MISQTLHSIAFGLLFATSALAVAISPRDDTPLPQQAIAIKLNPQASQGSLSTRAASGAGLVEELVNKALSTGNHAKRNVDFTVLPLFTTISPEKIAEMVKEAAERDPTYEPVDFSTWYQVQLSDSIQSTDDSVPPEVLDLLKTLSGYDQVKSAQRLCGASAQPAVLPVRRAVDPNDDPLVTNQGYLREQGINVQYAWGFPGGDGANTTLIDVELGWHLDHEDLKPAGITLVAGDNIRAVRGFGFVRTHGTSVLGEIFMADNGIGGVGVAPGAQGHVVGIRRGTPQDNHPEAIMDATAYLSFGDAMLLEIQVGDVQGELWPVEIYDAEYDAIRLAVAKGITVIEPAANGARDMDQPVIRPGETEPRGFLVKGSPDYRDSGAIMVGAGSAGLPHSRLDFSNHGGRVDVYAWGERISTTNVTDGGGDDLDVSTYTDSFAGTSGAAPIIAGAVLSIQGMVSANRGAKLSPEEMKKLIVVGGTSSANPSDDRIGVQPNLKALIDGGHLK